MGSRPWKVYVNDVSWNKSGEATFSFGSEAAAHKWAATFTGEGHPSGWCGPECIVAGGSSVPVEEMRRTLYRQGHEPEVQKIITEGGVQWVAAPKGVE